MNGLLLGPIVGHTDEQSTRIWIRVSDNPALYKLRIPGVGLLPFLSTEGDKIEFGTAIALVQGLRPDWQYRYQVLRRRRVVSKGRGTFRTMPTPGSMAEVQFVFISCNHQKEEGAWQQLKTYIEKSKPRFLLMMGDQVYVDQKGSFWKDNLDQPSVERRQALVEKYQENWSRDFLREILANIPTYMIWDDHEIRNGWGSWAPDSPTLVMRYPRGEGIYAQNDAYFKDTRDVYWHFQMSHNPSVIPPVPEERKAMPFIISCGRLLILVLDSRGDRDVWRPQAPILGQEQWKFINNTVTNLPAEIDVLAIVTPTPIATISPKSLAQSASDPLERLAPDVRLFRKGDARRLINLIDSGGIELRGEGPATELVKLELKALEKTVFKVRAVISEVRDQWSHHFSRPEQAALIRKAGDARTSNRTNNNPREVIFLGGDIHIGGIFDITVSDPAFTAPCLVSSGISQRAEKMIDTIVSVDESFEVGTGIRSEQRELVRDYNFGIVHIIPTGGIPKIVPAIVHSGQSSAFVLQIRG